MDGGSEERPSRARSRTRSARRPRTGHPESSSIAGLAAAALFAVYPGSVYYGRTFTPDAAMVFFLTAALYASARWIFDNFTSWRWFWAAAGLTATAILAKPVAIVALVPIAAMLVARLGRRAFLSPQTWAFFTVALVPYLAYDAYLRTIAEWHWASGITAKHVLPDLAASLGSLAAFRHKLTLFRDALGMLPATMLGPFGAALFLGAVIVPVRTRSRALLFGWLAAMLAYAFAVVTVERVDYYLAPFLPLAALWTGSAAARIAGMLPVAGWARGVGTVFTSAALAGLLSTGQAAVRDYYAFHSEVYRRATALNAGLAPDALVVMGHYDPSVLYYINRKGWEEDPLLWTPFDEESAIRKGARYFIAVEARRLARNGELCHWLERFPLLEPNAVWPVYETDPAKMLPGAEARWQAFRRLELGGRATPCAPPTVAATGSRPSPRTDRSPAPTPARPPAGTLSTGSSAATPRR